MTTDLCRSGIGIFDSGFGGLTVMRAIRQLLPCENIIYFGDTARLPYGNKSPDIILRYAIENSTFLIDQGIKVLVIACHTACSFALEHIRAALEIPVVGISEPGIAEVVNLSKNGHVAIIGTRATIASGIYQQKLQLALPKSEITAIACPLFVPLVEEGFLNHPLTELVVQEYLGPLKSMEIDTILLGCTHYPLLQPAIQKHQGDKVVLVDPANACAKKTQTLLRELGLENQEKSQPLYQFYVSDDPDKFRMHGKTFLNYPIEDVRFNFSPSSFVPILNCDENI